MNITKGLVVLGVALTPVSVPVIAAESQVMEEIVVTSRRKDESVQDVPLSVTAFGQEAIEQLKPVTLRDFDGLAPNVYIGMNTAGPGASALYIRGVGYADIEKTQSPQVGVIVDGLQMGSSTGQLIDVFDVESIEVNRGPQGIFFGKNTIGGNIVVNRVRPDASEMGYKVSAEVGNYSSRIFKGRVNVPLIEDELALKVGVIKRDRDGYYDNLTLGGSAGDVDFQSFTVALGWTPTDDLTAILTYDRIDDESQIPPQDPRFNGDNPFENLADKREPTTYEVDNIGLRVDWALSDSMTLHSITGLHDGFDLVNQDFDGGSINGAAIPFAQLHTLRDQEFEMFTQELRLDVSLSEAVDLMVGMYYYDSELEFRQDTNNVLQLPPVAVDPAFATLDCATINLALQGATGGFVNLGLRANPAIGDALCQFPSARSTQVAGEQVDSISYFAALTFRPSDDLEFTAGARYIDEEKSAFNSYFDYTAQWCPPTGVITGTTIACTPGTFFGEVFSTSTATEHQFGTANPAVDCVNSPTVTGFPCRVGGNNYTTPTLSWSDTIASLSGSWRITDSNMAYFSYSQGFRSGGFSIRNASGAATAAFEPETADQIEIGIKNEFDRLRVNLAYFVIERENGQFSSIITLPPGSIPGTTTLINNGGTSETSGFELESQFFATDQLRFIFNAGVIDVENDAFTLPCDILDGCVTATVGVLDPPGTLRNLGGNSDSRQPDWNASLQVAYDAQVGPGNLGFNLGYKKVGDFLLVNTGGGADQRLFEGGYGQWDARIAYSMEMSGGDTVSISLFGKNLGDEEWKEQALFLGGPNTGFQGWGAPATYALELTWDH